MKFSLIATLGLAASVIASPLTAVKTRAVSSDSGAFAENTVSDLLVQVKQYTSSINATASSVNSSSTPAEKASAQASAQQDIQSITNAVTAAKGTLAPYYGQPKGDNAGPIASLLKELLDEINAANTNLEDALGLGALGQALEPLDNALDSFVIGLGGLVDGLLGLVGNLLTGLTGSLRGVLGGLLGSLGL